MARAAPILATAQLRAIEAAHADRVPSLMACAGQAVAEAAERRASETGAPVLVVAGPGNNGGDAWVAAARLRERHNRVVVLDVAGTEPRAPEAAEARRRLRALGGEIVREWPAGLWPSLVVDGLLGIGLARDVEGDMIQVISRVNSCGAPVLAIDVPSGLDAESGRIRGVAVRADATLTFIALKPGLCTGEGPEVCGALEVDDLGTAAEVQARAKGGLLTPDQVRGALPPRRRTAHKGDHGSVAIVGGHRGMVGAALLAARAALHCGAGKVLVGLLSPEGPGVDARHPELMFRAAEEALSADALVVGPGAGRSPSATSASVFERSVLPAAIAQQKPLVLDADGLNAVAFSDVLRDALLARRAPTLLTPHPAEAARLLGQETAHIQDDRVASALQLARRFHAHVVLKGAGSVCAFPDGTWSINATGNAGLASGGTGDVLAGMIGALLAQGLAPGLALQCAVCLHGAAADALVARGIGPVGLTASELIPEARRILNEWATESENADGRR